VGFRPILEVGGGGLDDDTRVLRPQHDEAAAAQLPHAWLAQAKGVEGGCHLQLAGEHKGLVARCARVLVGTHAHERHTREGTLPCPAAKHAGKEMLACP